MRRGEAQRGITMKFELNVTNAQPTGAPAIATREANGINSEVA